MAELRLQIPDALAEKFHKATGLSPAGVMKEAMTFYNWTVEESFRGRLILSATPDGENITRLAYPSLEAARARGQQPVKLLKPFVFKKPGGGFNL